MLKLLGIGSVVFAFVACGEGAGTSSRGLIRGPGTPAAAGGTCGALVPISDSAGGAAAGDSAGGAAAGDTAGGAGAGESNARFPGPDYVIDPAALDGCRSPDEDGCFECCELGTDPCAYQRGRGDDAAYTEVGVHDGPCEPTCKPCAACSKRAEENLRDRIREAACECDCDTVEPVVDACFVHDSCACSCGAISNDLLVCPPAAR